MEFSDELLPSGRDPLEDDVTSELSMEVRVYDVFERLLPLLIEYVIARLSCFHCLSIYCAWSTHGIV